MSNNNHSGAVQNRSEIIFLFDAKDANPNGNPLSGDDRPRIDPHTGQAVVTDVRVKRYLRDQFSDDFADDPENGVYIADVRFGDNAPSRDELLDRCFDTQELPDDSSEALGAFLDYAIDTRMFGAAFTFDDKTEASDKLSDQPSVQGPVQFSPSMSLNEVVLNNESRRLSNIIRSKHGEDASQGSIADDYRLKYGVFPVHGVVNENAARDTGLTEADVERLDTAMWRALKNQALSRSKKGQEPRLYLRVEYSEDNFHLGLNSSLDLASEKGDAELRNITDYRVDVSKVVTLLRDNSDRVDTVHVTADPVTQFNDGDSDGGRDFLYETLEDAVGSDSVRVIDVYEDSPETSS